MTSPESRLVRFGLSALCLLTCSGPGRGEDAPGEQFPFLFRTAFESDVAGTGYKPLGWTDHTSDWHTSLTADQGVDGSQGLRITLSESGVAKKERGLTLADKTFGSDYTIDVDAKPGTNGRSSRLVFVVRFDPIKKNTYSRLWIAPNNAGQGITKLVYQEVIDGLAQQAIFLAPMDIDLWDGQFRHWKITAEGEQISVDLEDGAYRAEVPAGQVTLSEGEYTIGLSTGMGDVADFDNVFVTKIGK